MPMQSESCSQWRFDPVLRTGRQGSGNTKDVEDLVKGWNLRRGLNLDSLACIACPSPPSPPTLKAKREIKTYATSRFLCFIGHRELERNPEETWRDVRLRARQPR